jgi:hypothetical protein
MKMSNKKSPSAIALGDKVRMRDRYPDKLRPAAESRLLLLLLLANWIAFILSSGRSYYSIFGWDWGKLPINFGVEKNFPF